MRLTERPDGYDLYSRTMKTLDVLAENTDRKAFGFRSIGDGWVNETILYSVVVQIYRGNVVLRRFPACVAWRPGALDVFCPELKIAFEYQGQQHYFPIETWGGAGPKEKDFRALYGITLIEIAYNEPLTEAWIKVKIDTSGPGI